jgi:hypothetical protein
MALKARSAILIARSPSNSRRRVKRSAIVSITLQTTGRSINSDIAKLAALYDEHTQDWEVTRGVNEIEELTSNLGRKILKRSGNRFIGWALVGGSVGQVLTGDIPPKYNVSKITAAITMQV